MGREEGVVSCGGLAARRVQVVEVAELDAEHGGLEGVEPGVEADLVVVILRLHAVDAQPGQLSAEDGVVGRHHARRRRSRPGSWRDRS